MIHSVVLPNFLSQFVDAIVHYVNLITIPQRFRSRVNILEVNVPLIRPLKTLQKLRYLNLLTVLGRGQRLYLYFKCLRVGVTGFATSAARRTSSLVNTAKRKGCDSRK
jgi:hypothetical protein